MSRSKLREEQADRSFVSSDDLRAGFKTFLAGSGFGVVSTATAGPAQGLVTLSSVDLIALEIEVSDVITLSGTGGADGDYRVLSVSNATQLLVSAPSGMTATTGGLASLWYKEGALYSFLNTAGLGLITGPTVQDALRQSDAKFTLLDADLAARTVNLQSAESLGLSTTTATAFSTKVTLNAGILASGAYMLGFFYNWYYASTTTDFRGQIRLNGASVLMEHRQEPQDAGTDQRNVCSGSFPVTLSGSSTLTLEWASAAAPTTAGILNARLWLYKIPA